MFSSVRFQGSALAGTPIPVFGQVSLSSGTQMPISGTVTFTGDPGKGPVALGSLTLDANTGTFAGKLTLPSAGTWVLTAVYSGDSNVIGTQTEEGLTVDSGEASTMSLSSNLPAVVAGNPVTFTAEVGSTVVLKVPTGTVTFMDGSTSLGTATLDGYGVAKLTTSGLAGGTHSITANYSGDAIFRAASATFSQAISDYAVQSVTPSISIQVGQSGTATFAVTPQGGFNQSISFSCAGLPSGASCSFAPATVTPNGTDLVTDTMTVSTNGSTTDTTHRATYRRLNWFTASGFGLAGILILLPVASRKRRARLVSLAGLVLMLGLWGCGGRTSTPSPTPTNPMDGTYSVTVTATSPGGPTHSASLSVTITQ